MYILKTLVGLTDHGHLNYISFTISTNPVELDLKFNVCIQEMFLLLLWLANFLNNLFYFM